MKSADVVDRQPCAGGKSDGRYRHILETVDGGVWAIDAAGVTDYINARGAETLGYPSEEVLGQSALAFVFPEDLADAQMMLERCKQGSKERGAFRMRRKDGAERWIDLTANPFFGELGEYLGAVATFTDATESRRLTVEAQRNANELHHLYDDAPCGYHSLDTNGMVVQINDTELGWLGYTRDQVEGKMRFIDLMPPQYSDRFTHNFALLKERGRLRDNDYEMRRKDGSTFPVLISATAVKDSNGQFIRSRASVFDITKRKFAENSLGESEIRNAAILRAALDCIVSIDTHGKIIEFNPAAERTFGCTREQAVGKDVAEMIIPHAMRGAHHRGMEQYKVTGEGPMLGKRVHVTAMRSDGSEFPVELAITPVELRDQTIFTAYLRDITKEKWAERELRHYGDGLRAVSRRLVEVQETERRALANELHDLVGQKLTALSINLNIVKSQLSPTRSMPVGARLEDSLTLVEETIESIRNVMAELRPAVLDDYGLTPVLRWYAEQFTKRTGVATEIIEQGPSRRLPPAAEEALFRIAQEALANVAKYARAQKATVTLGATPQVLCLTIADDGCGFDPTASHYPARDHGWGLMIMKERAAAVGAQLNVESAPGRGARVIVTLMSDMP
jgi:PAS domain S-box-containing protein